MRLENRAPDNNFSAGLIRERDHSENEPSRKTNNTYDILIPIHNAYEYVKQCIESVLKYTPPIHSVILLDDASTDPQIRPLLLSFEKSYEHVKFYESKKNIGFVKNINRGLFLSHNNVIILNSDTVVTPHWLERLDQCLRSDSSIGIISPLSNNATILSVPIMNTNNKLPESVTPEIFAEIISSCSQKEYPDIPTAVGFCMLIARKTLDKIGPFDISYGLGYGEENDYCLRALQLGIRVVCCDDAYVHHYGEASFGKIDDIHQRRQKNFELLGRRWPSYQEEVFGFCRKNPLRIIQERIAAALHRHLNPSEKRPHILHVIHDFKFNVPGGTDLHTGNIIDGLASRYRSTVISPLRQPELWSDMSEERTKNNIRILQLLRKMQKSMSSLIVSPLS